MYTNRPQMSVPFVIKDLPVPTNISFGPRPVVANSAVLMEYQRLQFYEYIQATSNVRCEHPAFLPAYAIEPYSAQATVHGHPSLPFVSAPFTHFDFRGRFFHEEPKPQQSYIGLIAKAILSSAEKKLILSDIYQYILDNYPYFRNRGPGWRNSIRHNLSLNDCFIKAGRSANGKGHYWAIHPANVEDFKKGDFTRRKAQRKVRKHMGLDIAEEDDNSGSALPLESNHTSSHEQHQNMLTDFEKSEVTKSPKGSISTKRRMFDVESLLAPDHPEDTAKVNTTCSASGNTRVSPPSDLWVNNHHHNQYGCEKTLNVTGDSENDEGPCNFSVDTDEEVSAGPLRLPNPHVQLFQNPVIHNIYEGVSKLPESLSSAYISTSRKNHI